MAEKGMGFSFSDIEESIRFKQNKMYIKVLTVSGKDGEHYIVVCPSLLVSGYGNTPEEASEAFQHNMEVFCKDLTHLSKEQRDAELRKMGFVQKKFHNKNFSKAYVDENGVLQGLEPESKRVSMLEAAL